MTLVTPILVTGTPRSGKSLVAGLLSADPDVAFMSEPLTLWDIGGSTRNDDCLSADDASESVRRTIRNRCAQRLKRASRQRYLDDLAHHAIRIPFVHRVMPEARIVHVIRDPRAAIPEMYFGWTYRDTVVRALIRRWKGIHLWTLPRHLVRFVRNYVSSRVTGARATWGPRVPGLADFQAEHTVIETAAYQWMKMVEIARRDLATLDPAHYLEVRFENLLEHPEREAARLADFCQVRVEVVSQAASKHVSRNYRDPEFPERQRVVLSDEDCRRVYALIGPLAAELGYDTCGPARRQNMTA